MISLPNRNLSLFCFFMIVAFIIPAISIAQSSSQKISECFIKNDFTQLSAYFEPEVNVELHEEEKTLSKAEAKNSINGFFHKNPIKDFNLIHEGGSGSNLKYFIGNISTSSNKYRTYVLYREEDGKIHISEVRIEAEE